MPIGSGVSGVGRETGLTCGELITNGLSKLGKNADDPDFRAAFRRALNEAVRIYNAERLNGWQDRVLTTTVTLVAATATYSLATNFRKSLGRGWLLNSSSERVLPVEELTFEQYLDRVSDETVSDSDPEVFYIDNRVSSGQLTLWPAPSSSTVSSYPSFEYSYMADIPTCSSDDDTLAVSGTLEQCIFDQAVSIANADIGDDDRVDRYDRRAAQAILRARAYDATLRVNMGRLRGLP